MDVVTFETHRALRYVNAIQTSGGTLPAEDLEEYMRRPELRPAKMSPTKMQQLMMETASSAFSAFGQARTEIAPAESWAEYLTRLGWTTGSFSGVLLTPLGKALLRHMEKPDLGEEDSPVTVIIDPADKIAYAKVLNAFSNAGPGMIVDAYVRFEQLGDLLALGNITRILTSDKDIGNRGATFPFALRTSTTELRILQEKKLHDRYFISDAGRVLLLGTSLNGITKRPGVVVPIADPIAEQAVVESYNAFWRAAEPLLKRNAAMSPTEN